MGTRGWQRPGVLHLPAALSWLHGSWEPQPRFPEAACDVTGNFYLAADFCALDLAVLVPQSVQCRWSSTGIHRAILASHRIPVMVVSCLILRMRFSEAAAAFHQAGLENVC
jgi:hypothetical protein